MNINAISIIAVSFYYLVCGEPPALKGYKLYSVVSKAYGSTIPVICDVGYMGKPAAIRCQADGEWSGPEGCTNLGKFNITVSTKSRTNLVDPIHRKCFTQCSKSRISSNGFCI